MEDCSLIQGKSYPWDSISKVIESAGRAYAVETRYVGRDTREPIERQIAEIVARALRADAGSLLVFLPGAAEIRRTETFLRERVSDPLVDIVALYGALEADVQDRAIAPAPAGRRKVVLATSIAETSLTIEGVRVVIDFGLARVPRYEPDVGLTRLETVRVSRASADQRRGRAGRTEPGICYRLWDEPQTASLDPANKPEMLAADLSGLVLDLAHWGVADPSSLAFLDPPPAAALTEAKALLGELGAIDGEGRITEEGRRLRQPAAAAAPGAHGGRCGGRRRGRARRRGRGRAHRARARRQRRRSRASRRCVAPRAFEPRARCTCDGAAVGADCSVTSSPLARSAPSPLAGEGWGGGSLGEARAVPHSATPTPNPSPQGGGERREHSRGDDNEGLSPGALLALAYPDRVARSRGAGGAFLLANGRGANVDPASPLSREPFLAVAEISGTAAQGRIVLAAALTLAEIEAQFSGRIESRDEIVFDEGSGSLRARRLRRLGAIALAEQAMKVVPDDATARMLAEGIARLGIGRLPWTNMLRQWRDRIMFLRQSEGDEWPDLSDAALATTAADWLAPALAGKTAIAALGADGLTQALHDLLPWNLRRRLDAEAPTHFTAPSGSIVPIDYEADEGPKLADPRAGAVRPRPSSRHCRRTGAAGGRAVVAGAPAGAGDARPAGLLARQLCRGQSRDEGPLSPPSLAR